MLEVAAIDVATPPDGLVERRRQRRCVIIELVSEDWMTVRTVGTEEEAAVLAGFLESRGLPVVVDSRLFRQEPVTFGHLARIEVKVPSEHHARARELLEQGAESIDRSAAEDE